MWIMICLNNDIDIKMILLNNYYDQDTSGAGVMLGKVYTSPMAESRLVPEWCLQKSFDYSYFHIDWPGIKVQWRHVLMTMEYITLISWHLESCPGLVSMRGRSSSAWSWWPPAPTWSSCVLKTLDISSIIVIPLRRALFKICCFHMSDQHCPLCEFFP